jgi:hypothetical protein
MSERPLLPPRVKKWKKGHRQVGLFLRTKTGGTVQMVMDDATELDQLFVMALIRGVGKLPPALIASLRAEVERPNIEGDRG